MTARIGWYIHHHGRGHLTRMRAIAEHLDAEVDCYSSLPRPEGLREGIAWTQLPRDDDPAPRLPQDDPTVGGLLHWAPLGHAGHRARLAILAAQLHARPVGAFVVDVSVEVTLWVRLLGIRTVVMTQPGERVDEPHRLAFAAADRIIAPWPRELSVPRHLAALGEKVTFVGGISRFADRAAPGGPVPGAASGGVLVLGGGGGAAVGAEDVAAAERSTGRPWLALGVGDAGWRDDPWRELTSARTVVSWCGQNAVADLAAARATAVVIPQERPFAEQRETAAVLERAGLAVVLDAWPDAAQWPQTLDRAAALSPDWSVWQVAGASGRAARVIAEVAGR